MSVIRKIPKKVKLSHAIKNVDNDDFLSNIFENVEKNEEKKSITIIKNERRSIPCVSTSLSSQNEKETKVNIPNLLLPLKEHQHFAVQWMCDTEERVFKGPNPFNIRGGVLSDAPGLGKTLSTLCLCIKQELDRPENESGFPNLIICPKIVIDEWCSAIDKFFGDKYYYLTLKSNNYKEINIQTIKKYKFVITNYEHINSIMKEFYFEVLEENKKKDTELRKPLNEKYLKNKKGKELIVDINWNRIICDESHRLNNASSLTFLSIVNLISNKRWCLTGTPIRNYEKDIYHQFLFIGYNNFIGRSRFTYNQYRTDKLYKHVLKRSYSDVDIEMPDFEEKYIYIKLTDNEKVFYENINGCLKKAYKQFSSGYASFSNVLHLFLRLRQMCVSSFAMVRQLNKLKKYRQYKSPKKNIDSDLQDIIDSTQEQSEWYSDILNNLIPDELEEWVNDKFGSGGYMSSKITAVLNILENIKHSEKVLIYTCFKTHMDIIQEAIESKLNENVLTLNGDYDEDERQLILNKFKKDNNHNIMIINYKLGSEGLNLMEANNVILCENWWCPSVMEQAKHRAYRIGQIRKVNIFNIITENTIEEKIKKICDKKEDLGKSFMNDAFDTFKQKDYKLNSTTLKRIIF
jgi:SNF2 family DNA or RNA helicase